MGENNKKQQVNSINKRKSNILKISAIIIFVFLFMILAPKLNSIYQMEESHVEEIKNKQENIYPLEVSISEEDAKFFVEFFYDYSIGIRASVDFLDGITENEMIDFCRAILSEKYWDVGVIPEKAMNSALKKYFDVSNLDYNNLGYDSFTTYEKYKPDKVFNITKLMQTEKDSDIYLAYVDCIEKNNVKEETYNKNDVEKKYIFTFKKIVTEEIKEAVNITNFKYVLQNVEIEK